MTDNVPQFGIAEYPSASGTDICKSCNQPAVGHYYRVNGALACERCKEQLEAQLPKDSHAAFVRGLVFGVGGAILGLILYSAFGIITGLEIGYISLAVGYIVGKAMRMGSRGIGGRRYQVVAVILTYAAVSMSAIPIGISQSAKEKNPPGEAQVAKPPSADQESVNPGLTPNPAAQPAKPKMSLVAALAGLAVLGLASPFLELQDPFHGIIGLVILLIGIRIAWQLTASPKIEVLGPFGSKNPAAPAATP
jgi:predicted lipid-binding transport protein (Tim44 family)